MKTKQEKAPKFTAEELDAHSVLLCRGGSHLYGLNHAGSDEDFYRVVPDEHFWKAVGNFPSGNAKILARQTIIDGIDQMLVSEKTFHRFCYEGSPQALETMFAHEPIIDKLEAFRHSYFGGLNLEHMCGKYTRTIKAFSYGDFKKRRHALRMSFNLAEAMSTGGRFNPRLTPEQIAFATQKAQSNPQEFIEAITDINYFTIDEDWNWAELEKVFAG